MAELATAEFSVWGQKESSAALESRQGLPTDIQLALPNVLYEICAGPKDYPPTQLKPINRAGTTFLYDHPQPKVQVTFELDETEHTIYFMHYAAVTVAVRKKVFVSYAHEDAEVLTEMRKWLKPLERSGIIELWDDSEIHAGDEWLAVIEEQLGLARLALLLVSDSFAGSDFIMDKELPTILQGVEGKGVRLLWVAVSHAPLEHLGLAKYQGLNDPDHPLEEFEGSARKAELKKVYQKIEAAVRA